MSLILTVVSGSRRGENFPLRDGLTIGRKKADVALEDARVSGLHARISGRDGAWVVHDNGSKNGLKDARGRLVDHVVLLPKTLFSVGETTFRVDPAGARAAEAATVVAPARPAPAANAPAATVARAQPPRSPAPAAKPAAPAAASEAVAPEPGTSVRRTWNDALAQLLIDHLDRFKDRPRGLVPLEPALVLEFTRGPQVNAKWILGYGPRRIGPGALDLPLWDVDLPPVCFEIHPGREGLVFRTEHRELVRLNGRPVDSDVLRTGDTIQIRDTLIEVDFIA